LKKAILLILLLPLAVFSVLALEECPRFGLVQEDIPCIQPSSWYPPGQCEDYNVTVFDQEEAAILNTSWYAKKPFCAFNVTGLNEPGTYCYNSSVESGCITLEREDNMLSIILVQIGLIVFFILVGLPYRFGFLKFTSWAMAALEIMMTVWIVYINETGSDITTFLYLNAYGVLVIGGTLSFITIITIMVRLMTKEKPVNDDGYTKFVLDTK